MLSVTQDFKLEEIKNNYRLDDLKWRLGRATESLNHLQTYISEVQKQMVIVEKTEFKPVVVFKRSYNSYRNKVEYYVWLEMRPQIEGKDDSLFCDSFYIPFSCHKQFEGGNQKKAAQEYAEELARTNGDAEIEMIGF